MGKTGHEGPGAGLSKRWGLPEFTMGRGRAEVLFIGVETIAPHSPLRPRTLRVALPIAPHPPTHIHVQFKHQSAARTRLPLQRVNSYVYTSKSRIETRTIVLK